jgi:hypothetical protein
MVPSSKESKVGADSSRLLAPSSEPKQHPVNTSSFLNLHILPYIHSLQQLIVSTGDNIHYSL